MEETSACLPVASSHTISVLSGNETVAQTKSAHVRLWPVWPGGAAVQQQFSVSPAALLNCSTLTSTAVAFQFSAWDTAAGGPAARHPVCRTTTTKVRGRRRRRKTDNSRSTCWPQLKTEQRHCHSLERLLLRCDVWESETARSEGIVDGKGI